MSDHRPHKEVFTIIERENAKPFWARIGIGFINRDNSINLILDGLPVNGRLHVRDARASQRKEEVHDAC